MGFSPVYAALWFSLGIVDQAAAFRIAKTDFRLLALEVQCTPTCDFSDHESGKITDIGFVGEGKFSDPENTPDLNADSLHGPRIVLGFPDEHFDWNRHTQMLTGTPYRLAVLNELSTSGKNYALLSLWKPVRDSLELMRLLPGSFSVALGDLTFQGSPRTEPGGDLVLMQAIGSDAGINVQAFYAVRIRLAQSAHGADQFEKVTAITNKTEIPVSDILARINDGKPAEEVLDSNLACKLGPGNSLHCSKTRTRILYTQEGPKETPLGTESFNLSLAPAGRKGN